GHRAHRTPKRLGARHRVLAGLLLHQQLDGNVEQQHAAYEPQIGQLQHELQTDGEDDAKQYGRGRAKNNAQRALPSRQRAAGERDDNGVVAGEQDVDPDDFEDLDANRAPVAEVRADDGQGVVDQLGPSDEHYPILPHAPAPPSTLGSASRAYSGNS